MLTGKRVDNLLSTSEGDPVLMKKVDLVCDKMVGINRYI